MAESSNKEPLEEIFEAQITDCCLWIDRLSRDRENLIQSYMVSQLSKRVAKIDSSVFRAFESFNAGKEDDLLELLEKAGMSMDQLRAGAFSQCADTLRKLEDLIHRQHQNIRHIQKTIDHVKLRPSLIRRLELQIEHAEQILSDKKAVVHHVESGSKTSK